jgi:hypothetical protein
MNPPRRTLALVAFLTLVGVAALAASCRLAGQGHLNVANDLSGIGRDNTEFRAYVADPGEPWPPPGVLNIYVRGDDFGRPPSYGMDGYLYLVSTGLPCPQSEGAPEAFTLPQVTIHGIVTVTNGSVNQFITVPDTAANRADRWALIDIPELAAYPGQHLIYRCGTVAWDANVHALSDPCTLRTGVDGQALTPGVGYKLNASRSWQFCDGGAAAGSREKLLFTTTDGGETWSLVSRTTLGNPPAEAGVGTLPNAGSDSALLFQDANKGWLGLSGPGQNFFKSTDGGHNWIAVAGFPSAVPVVSIAFSDADHGVVTLSDGTLWHTSDGGSSWAMMAS